MTALLFALVFGWPFISLVKDWWNLPEAGHGLLLAPVAVYLAWKAGIREDSAGNVRLGSALLLLAILVRFASALAAELFTMRGSMVLALAGLTVFQFGFRQLVRWWLPFLLVCLTIPLPEIVTQALALPLQFKASQMGAALLEMRDVPVRLTGNIIRLPGQELFVTEACSGLRSLTALISVAVLLSAIVCSHPITRAIVVTAAVPIAIMVNGIRVFLTGFLVYFVSPALGKGFMHVTEGWLLFLVSMALLGAFCWASTKIEGAFLGARRPHAS